MVYQLETATIFKRQGTYNKTKGTHPTKLWKYKMIR